MTAVHIHIELKNRTAFAPGETVQGSITIHCQQGPWTPTHAEALLFWRTEGRGDQDEGIAAAINLAEGIGEMPTSVTRDFSLPLPPLPWTYHGKALKVHWVLGVYLKGKPEIDHQHEVYLAVHGQESERERLRVAYDQYDQ
jgi:hypothetical protein